ncbi:GSCFA domain-containing protein [Flavihumibacter fluvii]|uniref:GSCFA domain-containing protein n=1 Tax=Flavihumibacter fluvii TaxID=2838157 RepID=UPI001BDE8715|nr:GSCFA domain-containing protein [Flavihumibacter fluvii]ULQ54268.1 GSCFA domain-containing protein [Flavihumibacter fluvii]
MKLMTDINIKGPETPIEYTDPLLLVGSCFTEHIGGRLADLKFKVLQNPHGILFDPISVCKSLTSYIEPEKYTAKDLFFYNELWQSWSHHSRYSGIAQEAVLARINAGQSVAHEFLASAKWLVITLGTSYSYRLVENGMPVANCHRAPAQWFNKHLCGIDETVAALDNMLYRLFKFNPGIRVIFTVSPVRHVRDGVVENNRSKARLLESVHHLVGKFNRLYYFPSYELLIDVLRDYRFYDIDLVHPNYQATEFVLEKFNEHYINPAAYPIMEQVQQILMARKHKAFQPETQAHRNFLHTYAEKIRQMQVNYPYLDFAEEGAYFRQELQ